LISEQTGITQQQTLLQERGGSGRPLQQTRTSGRQNLRAKKKELKKKQKQS
jgi:hypothetical protein